jgi:peptidyl-prolyl cis-trans isomerase D
MMEALRNGAKTWIAKLLLGLVMAVFALLGVSSMDVSATIRGLFKQDLASVGDKAIDSERFQQELKQTLQQMSQQSGTNVNIEEARKLGVDKQVLDRMISQASIEAQADRLGIQIGDKAVASVVHFSRFQRQIRRQSFPQFVAAKRNFRARLLCAGKRKYSPPYDDRSCR